MSISKVYNDGPGRSALSPAPEPQDMDPETTAAQERHIEEDLHRYQQWLHDLLSKAMPATLSSQVR